MQQQKRQPEVTGAEAQPRRLPFDGALLRAKSRAGGDAIKPLLPFAEAFAEKCGQVLSALGNSFVKASLEAATVEQLNALQQAEAGFDVLSGPDRLPLWFMPDQALDSLACELCLGGTGHHQPDTGEERPVSLLEKRLRELLTKRMAEACGLALAEIAELDAVSVLTRGRIPARKILTNLVCYKLRLLITAFDTSCECVVYLGLAMCQTLLSVQQSVASPAASSAADALQATTFAIDVLLKPDVLDVRQILNLAAGEVLKLNISAAAPVELRFNGKTIAMGVLGQVGDRAHVHVLDHESPLPEPKARFQPESSVS
jgi:flagellar motor switch protein FliM